MQDVPRIVDLGRKLIANLYKACEKIIVQGQRTSGEKAMYININ